MLKFQVTTFIAAPPAICFDLARSVEVHVASAANTRERAVAGRTSGLLELGDEVTWEAKHFAIMQRLTSQITQFRPPTFFQDRMIKGAFDSFEHDHIFQPQPGGTLMIDILRFKAPLGSLGWIAERLFLRRHLRNFLIKRGNAIKQIAENGHTDISGILKVSPPKDSS